MRYITEVRVTTVYRVGVDAATLEEAREKVGDMDIQELDDYAHNTNHEFRLISVMEDEDAAGLHS